MDSTATSTELLRPYLPRLLLHWLGESPDTSWRQHDGSIAFVDISGFTKLSERLAKRGKVGAEELADAIGTCFTRLLAVAYGNGGSLLKFGGDALLLFFSGIGHEAKACRAAVGMRRELRDIGKMDCGGVPVSLRMSVGVHSGTFQFFLVGDSHRELIVTGPAATETVLMESTAEAGEIVISRATASALPAHALGAAKGTGVLLRREPTGMTPERRETEPPIDEAALIRCIPNAIRDQLLAGAHEAEHRRVTVAFVHFDETDDLMKGDGPETVADHLDRLIRDVQIAVDRQGVSFLATDIDRDGGKIILAAGVPGSSGNDEERMLLALREIVDGDRRIPVRIGVNRGHVFAGDIGPFYRRTYTVMGDAVNLAARLMAKATAGQILSTDGVLELSHADFESVELEPFTVKGKAKPVRASSVGALRGARHETQETNIPLIGRERELGVVLDALADARGGRGRLIEIVGDPGIGKSRLLDEIRRRAADTIVVSSGGELYGSSTPYGVFRTVLRELLGLALDAAGEPVIARLGELLAALAPELLPWAPLIATVLDAEMPDTPETADLDDRFRRQKLNDVVTDLLGRLLRPDAMLIFDDAHWMDETSADLLGRLAREITDLPWLICVARRGTQEGFQAKEGASTTRIDLRPLDPQGATEMLTIATEDSPFRPDEIAALAERSGGNPLFLKELVAAARTPGALQALPDSIESLIMSRIDRLSPPDRNLLRRASVLGRSFLPDLLIAILNGETPDASTWKRLWEFLRHDSSGNLSFTSALMRDGAYEGLPYRLRRTLHAQVGETIEKSAGDSPDEEAELLSLHFFHAQRFAEAWRYSLVAAERAKAIYANVEAAEFFQRAIEAAGHIRDLSPDELGRVREALGDVLRVSGDFHAARAAYRSAQRRSLRDPVADARLYLKEAWVAERLDRYTDAIRWVRRATRLLEDVGGDEAAKQRAELALWEGVFRQAQGHSRDAIRVCQRAIAQAEAIGDRRVLARAYATLDWAYKTLGSPDDQWGWKALAIYEELGDLGGQAIALNNLGIGAFTVGRWDEAIQLYDRGRLAREKMGDPVFAADGTYNISEILSAQGRFDEAEEMLRQALRVWRATGYLSGAALAMSELGRLRARTGRFEDATSLLEEALAGFEHIGERQYIIETKARIAENLAFQGASESALAQVDEALSLAGAMDGVHTAAPMMHRIRGYAWMQLGGREEARRAFEESLALARQQETPFDAALALRALARLGGGSETSVADLEGESATILAKLGVLSVVDPPDMSSADIRPRVVQLDVVTNATPR
jgi:class 3 adenylate cyclase/tetratricopeptide (TPR) repeat protein